MGIVIGGGWVCQNYCHRTKRSRKHLKTLNFSTLKDMLKCLRQQMLEGMFPNFSGDQIVLNADF